MSRPLFEAWRDYVLARPEPVIRNWFGDFDWDLTEQKLPANGFSALRHLPDCAAFVGEAEQQLATTLFACSDEIRWQQMYDPEDLGRYFTDNYCHLELIGPKAHFVTDKISGGLVLYGPHVDYPDHWHLAEEIYIPLTGNGLWSRNNGDYIQRDAGEFIFHESNMPHAMKCEDTPMLALWIWHGGDLGQKAEF